MKNETHNNREQCLIASSLQHEEVVKNEKWMTLSFFIDAEGRLRASKTTCQFPLDMYHDCLKLAEDFFKTDVLSSAGLNPLPRGVLDESSEALSASESEESSDERV